MTRDDMLAALAPARLPSQFGALSLPEGMALVAIGLVLGVLAAALIRPLTRLARRGPRIRDLRPLPVPARLLALSRLLGHLPPALRGAAYGAEPAPSDHRIERIARLARLRRGWRG